LVLGGISSTRLGRSIGDGPVVLGAPFEARAQFLHRRRQHEHADDVVAHRTSPTNIGLQLISTLAAYDLGYVNFTGTLGRLEPITASSCRLRGSTEDPRWYAAQLANVPAPFTVIESGEVPTELRSLARRLTRAAAPGRWPPNAS